MRLSVSKVPPALAPLNIMSTILLVGIDSSTFSGSSLILLSFQWKIDATNRTLASFPLIFYIKVLYDFYVTVPTNYLFERGLGHLPILNKICALLVFKVPIKFI